jgi:dolichyl-diphosphooligosaccharide--protein glycosyltransferase
VDSGTFGEVVSSGIVEKVDGAYRVADREAVRVMLKSWKTHRTRADS